MEIGKSPVLMYGGFLQRFTAQINDLAQRNKV